MGRHRRAARAAARSDRAARTGATPSADHDRDGPSAAAPAADPGADPAIDPGPVWIEGLARVVRAAATGSGTGARTSLGCHVEGDRSRLFVPPEMPTLQPASLGWLLRFAARNGFSLVEDRRGRSETPFAERRSDVPPAIALGLGLLLRQTGLPGPVPRLSEPHRHAADAPFVELPELVAMAASAARRSKRVTVLPNRPLVDVLGGDTHPVQGYACKLDCAPARTVLSHFDAPNLRCLGYSSGRQYVVHLLLGGGPAASPKLWTTPATLARTDVRFRLFRAAKDARLDFGLLYSTFHFDMTGQRPVPWWLREETFTDAAARDPRAAAPVELALAG